MLRLYTKVVLNRNTTFKNGLTLKQLELLMEARNNTLDLLKSLEADKNDKATDVFTALRELDSLMEDTLSGIEE